MLKKWSHTVWMMHFREKTKKRLVLHNDAEAYEMELRTSLLRNFTLETPRASFFCKEKKKTSDF